MVLILLIIIFTFTMRPVWWMFFDEFFAFMAVFCQLVALYIMKYNQISARMLQRIALICAVLMVVAFIGEYIAFQVIYGA